MQWTLYNRITRNYNSKSKTEELEEKMSLMLPLRIICLSAELMLQLVQLNITSGLLANTSIPSLDCTIITSGIITLPPDDI